MNEERIDVVVRGFLHFHLASHLHPSVLFIVDFLRSFCGYDLRGGGKNEARQASEVILLLFVTPSPSMSRPRSYRLAVLEPPPLLFRGGSSFSLSPFRQRRSLLRVRSPWASTGDARACGGGLPRGGILACRLPQVYC